MPEFTFDMTAGMSEADLRDAYRRTSRACADWQQVALHLASGDPERVERLQEPYRARMKNLIAAYAD